ncbi:hypothetical protein [Microvirga roseola]|uniref:hypothetical protein n=1 Tax=Microvirga roseola TaxID=2883126 RepID=UPI0038990996
MMGERLVMQESLFYAFRLEDYVPSDHLLRRIHCFVDCSELCQHLAGFYSTYAAEIYREALDAAGLVGSMGRLGNPYDNAKAESFMKTLKVEAV